MAVSVNINDLMSNNDAKEFIAFGAMEKKNFLLRNDILILFENFCLANNKTGKYKKESPLAKFLNKVSPTSFRAIVPSKSVKILKFANS